MNTCIPWQRGGAPSAASRGIRLTVSMLCILCAFVSADPGRAAAGTYSLPDLPVFLFDAGDADAEFGGNWGLWPQQDMCRAEVTFLPDRDAENAKGGCARIEYQIRGEPKSFSLWIDRGDDPVDLSGYDRFVLFAKGNVPSFTLVVKDKNATDPDAPNGIADHAVTGVTHGWQRLEVPFSSFVPRRKGATVDWQTINHVAIAMIAPRDKPEGTLFVDNLRASAPALPPPALPDIAAGEGWTDDFDEPTLDARWLWRAPVEGPLLSLSERKGWLRIRVPESEQGFNHWNGTKPVDAAPQLRAAVPKGDWTMETRVLVSDFTAGGHFHVGLVAGVSDTFVIGLGPFQAPTLAGAPKTPAVWLEPTGQSGFCRVPGDATDVRLRLVRNGCVLRASLSRDGRSWIGAGIYLLPAPPTFLGLWAKTFSAHSPVTVDVDYAYLKKHAEEEGAAAPFSVGIGGEYPTGYRGLLARAGMPYEVLLDYQLADLKQLQRFDLMLVGSLPGGVANKAREALAAYVRAGGTALVDGNAFPPASVLPGKGFRRKNLPDVMVGGDHNPLEALLGKHVRFKAAETRHHYEPARTDGLQILARYDGKVTPRGKAIPVKGYQGTPAVWAMPFGRGLLVYSAPCIGASLSWGPAHDQLAETLIHVLAGKRLRPGLMREGVRFGRKQNPVTETESAPGTKPLGLPAFERQTLTVAAGPLPEGAQVIRKKPAPEFNISGIYRPEQGPGSLLLNHWNERCHIGVVFSGQTVRLTRVEDGRTHSRAEVSLPDMPSHPFVIRERRDRILFLSGESRGAIPAEGLWNGCLASGGSGLERVRYQPVEPAFLSDDFMRGEKEKGAWQILSGKWSVRAAGNAKMGANPFTHLGHAAKGPAMCMTGLPFWDDYRFHVSVKPTSASGTLGIAIRCRDARNCVLLRIRTVESGNRAEGGAELVRVANGNETVLARGDACLCQGQWYRLGIEGNRDTLTASVDGMVVSEAENVDLHTGKVALCVLKGKAEFDDVAVRPPAFPRGKTATELDGPVPRFAGTMDRDTWAGTVLQWRADAATPGRFWRNGRFWGDFALSFRSDLGKRPAKTATLSLLLTETDSGIDKGYRILLRREPGKAQPNEPAAASTYALELFHMGTRIERLNPLAAGPTPTLELRRTGPNLSARVDGKLAFSHRMTEPPAQLARLGFEATGFLPGISGLRLSAGNVVDTCFDHAPVNWWIGSGVWELAVRWPCTPEWSWLAGEGRNRGEASLWHKWHFEGDAVLDLHVGPRTVDHGEGRAREICRAFNVVLCGDGRNVKSGYSFVVGDGKHGAGAILTRRGKVVAQEPAYRIYSDAHNQWINVRAEKEGEQVRLWVDDQCIINWRDPEPLNGGRIAAWTDDNAIMIPRATIYHSQPARRTVTWAGK